MAIQLGNEIHFTTFILPKKKLFNPVHNKVTLTNCISRNRRYGVQGTGQVKSENTGQHRYPPKNIFLD